MRFIDDKGRLFGLVNLIDLAVLLLILAMVASVTLNIITRPIGQEKATDKKTDEKMSVDTIEVKIIFTNVQKVIIQDPSVLAPGTTVNNGKATIVKVLETVDRPSEGGIDFCNVTVIMNVKCVNLLGDYYCNNFPIKINSPLTISNPYYTLYGGTIIGMKVLSNE